MQTAEPPLGEAQEHKQSHSTPEGAARTAERGTSRWLQIIQQGVQDLKSQDIERQRHGAKHIGYIAINPSTLLQLEDDLLASGAMEAMAGALHSSDWDVKGHAALSLAALATFTPRLASQLPATAASALVEMLTAVQNTSVEEWCSKVTSLNRETVQASAAGLLGILSTRIPIGPTAVEAVPLLAHLLDVDSKENRVRSAAARALGQIAAHHRDAQDAIAGSGAIEKIAEWLEYDVDGDDLTVVAAEALGGFASCSQDMRDLMENVFDTLMRKLAELTRKEAALTEALMHWGIERMEAESPKYS